MRIPYRSGMALRLVGSKEVPATSGLKIYEAGSGDEVADIVRVELSLSSSPRWITAQVTVYERDEHGRKFARDGAMAKKTEGTNVVDVDLTTRDSKVTT